MRYEEIKRHTRALECEVAERRRAEEALAEKVRELARSNSDLERFANAASHDLQEPLRMVAIYTELLSRRYKGRLDADADEFIGFAVEGAVRMQQMIEGLLAYSRTGSNAPVLGRADSERALDRALRDLRAAIETTSARVTHDPLPPVRAEEWQLVQLFENLIANAVKFRAHAPPSIHLSADRRGDQWAFSVKDNGIGIDMKFKERVFVMFQRLGQRDAHPGSGIGLAICKRIVERHGGAIWVESEPGRGSTFFFTLPAAAEHNIASAEALSVAVREAVPSISS